MNLQDINTIEGGSNSEAVYFAAIQRAINSGTAWSFQGSYGRAMMAAIESGHCMLGPNDARDYYGNHVPSRDQVQEGTKGSYTFVADRHGSEWADAMEKVS